MVSIVRLKAKYKKNWQIIALFLLCLFVFVSHFIYVARSYAYPVWDEHKYLGIAIRFFPILKHPTVDVVQKFIDIQKIYISSAQPLYPLFIAIPLAIFGTCCTYKIALWINGIFYIMTIVGVYFIGKEFLSKKASLLAAFIFAFYGFPLFYLHFAYTETTATAFITLSLVFLARAKKISTFNQIILFSVFGSLAFLTRWTTPFFIIGPFFANVVGWITQLRQKHSKRHVVSLLKPICILVVVFVIPFLLYYFPQREGFLDYLRANRQLGSSWMPGYLRNTFSTHSIIWYLSILAEQTIFFYALFLTGVILAFIYWKKYSFILLGVIVPYFILTFESAFKDDRFIVPIYPMMALTSVIVFDFLKEKKFNTIYQSLLFLTIVLGFLNFFGASWGIGPMKFSIKGDRFTVPNSILVSMPIGHPRRIWLAPVSWPPRPNEGNANLIVDAIQKDWGKNKNQPYILQTFEMEQVGTAVASIVSYERINVFTGSGLAGIPAGAYNAFFEAFDRADYLLVKNGIIDKGYKEGTDKSWDKFIYFDRKFNKMMQLKESGLPKAFVPVGRVFVPFDKSTLIIYRKKREVTEAEWKLFGYEFKMIDQSNSEKIDKAIQHLVGSK